MSNPLRLPVPLQNWHLSERDYGTINVKQLRLLGPKIEAQVQVTGESVAKGGQAFLDSHLNQMVGQMQQQAIVAYGLRPLVDQEIRDAKVAQATKLSHALFEATDRAVSINQLRSTIRDIVAQFIADES